MLQRGMVMDFVDDDRTEAWTAVRRAEARRELRHELFLTRRVEMSSEAHPFRRAAKTESVAVAGEIGIRVAGEEEHVIAAETEREAAVRSGCGIEVRFIDNQETSRRNESAVGEAKFVWHGRVVSKEPAAEIHRVHRWIEQLHGIESWRRGT